MTPDRFRTLVDRHGADPARWPSAERDPARALAQGNPELQSALAEAAALDAWLDADAIAAPDAALVDRIVAMVPAGSSPTPRFFSGWPRWLLHGAGLAGIGLAGSLAGVVAVTAAARFVTPPVEVAWMDRGSAFTPEPALAWSEE